MKKTLAILLSLALVICMLPSVAFAEATALTGTNVTLSSASVVYNGASQAPAVTVTVGGSNVDASHYTVTYKNASTGATVSSMKDVGTYKVVVAAATDDTVISGSVENSFAIEKATISNAIINMKPGQVLYNSEDFEAVTVDGRTTYQLKESAKSKISVMLGSTELTSGFDMTGTIASANATSANITISTAETANFQSSSKTINLPVYNRLHSNAGVIGETVIEIPTAYQTLTYTGNALTPPYITVKRVIGIDATGVKTYATLWQGTDYVLEFYADASYSKKVTEIKNAGNYYVKAVGIGSYSGAVQGGIVSVASKSISSVTVTAENAIEGTVPVLTVTDLYGSVALRDGIDYAVMSNVVTKVATETATGTGTITIQGKGNYTGTKTVTYTTVNAANDISKAVVSMSPKMTTIGKDVLSGYYYNGMVQVPTFTIKVGTKTLTASDYKVEYSFTNEKGEKVVTTAPVKAKAYSMTIKGIGNYAGQIFDHFTINEYPMSAIVVDVSQASATATPVVSVKSADGSVTFAVTTDYTISGPYVTSSTNTASVYIYAATNGNLKGDSRYISYNIAPKSLALCSVVADASSKYTGAPIVPSVKVLDGATTLSLGAAYTVTYTDAAGNAVSSIKDAGTYNIVVTGLNGYTGTVVKSFTVLGNSISGATITLNTTSIDATGYNVSLPAILSVRVGSTPITDANYTKSYQDATGKTITEASTPGTYYVVITGKGVYQDSAKVAFEIKGTDQTISVTSASLVKTYRNSDEFALGAACSTSKLTYTSSDSAIASVTSDGIVTPMGKAGTATITITAPAAGKYNAASATVTVVARPYKAKVTSVSSPKAGSLKAYVAKQTGCTGYQVVISKSSTFKTGTRFFKKIANNPKYTTSQSVTYTGLASGKYYVKARAMYVAADGSVAYGNYGAVQTVTVK